MEIIEKLELIDLFFLILCLRISYIAVSGGILKEILKILGLLCGSILAFHYYPFLAIRIEDKFLFLSFLRQKERSFCFVSYLLIFVATLIVISLLRGIVIYFFKKEKISIKEKLSSLFAGLLRFVFLASIIIFFFYLTSLHPKYYSNSVSYRVFKNIAPQTYLVFFKFYNKFDSQIKINKEVEEYYETKKFLSGSNKKGK